MVHLDIEDEALLSAHAARLIAAGDPRGELIRLQCEQERRDRSDPAWDATDDRIAALLETHTPVWLGRLAGLLAHQRFGRPYHFRRGFVDWVEIRATDFLKHATWILKEHPLHGARLREVEGHVAALALCPELRFLDQLGLDLERTSSPVELAELLNSEVLERVTRLDLSGIRLGGQAIRCLLDARVTPRLRLLDLGVTGIDPDAAALLAASPAVGDLTILGLHNNSLKALGVAALCASPHLGALEELLLGFNFAGPLCARALAGSGNLPRLKKLTLCEEEIGDEGMAALGESPLLAQLEYFEADDNNITAAGLRPAMSSQEPGRLRTLILYSNPLGDAGAELLARAPRLATVKRLDLGKCGITDRGVIALAGSCHLADLETLGLWTGSGGGLANTITDKGAFALARSPHLPRLRSLNLNRNAISLAACQELRERFGNGLCV